MINARVTGLRNVELGVPDLDKAAAFYRNVWGLEDVVSTADTLHLRGTGAAIAGVATFSNLNIDSVGTAYTLTSSATGAVSKTITAKTKGTTYYRWHVVATATHTGPNTSQQKVIIK